ncbi:MAG: universal stress protein [Gammaproteobacteria bacterium]
MQAYKHILVATDFSEYTQEIAARAQELAQKYNAQLSIVHIFDSLPIKDLSNDFVVPYDFDLQDELLKAAEQKLRRCAEQLQIPETRQWLELGNPGVEITRIAERQNADLIVLGSHGRSGLALLLGSTASSVLHHAKCDVLAVRIKEAS